MNEPVQQAPDRPASRRLPLFLERSSYRRRRLRDAARLLPILGVFLFFLPLLWPEQTSEAGGAPPAMSSAITYVFGAWAALILLAVVFGQIVKRTEGDREAEDMTWPR
ncbi:MAG: hypothetical protein AB3N11_14380 [Arenibacterium sp.]